MLQKKVTIYLDKACEAKTKKILYRLTEGLYNFIGQFRPDLAATDDSTLIDRIVREWAWGKEVACEQLCSRCGAPLENHDDEENKKGG